jgi:uncharacterized protein
MKCPVCKEHDLLIAERRSVEIDYCPSCRGVWLDRGELDKLIAQDAALPDSSVAPRANRDGHRDRDHSYERNRGYGDHGARYGTQRKKRSIFDVFDFD